MRHRERSQKIKACIFDLDGVLVDTAIYHYRAWKKLAQSLGFDFSKEDNEHLKGVNRISSLKMILSWAGLQKSEEEIERLAELKNQWYKEMIASMDSEQLLPGVTEFLKELRSSSYLLAVGSASKNAEILLAKTGVRNYFDVVVDGTLVSKSKPDPTVFLKAAELLSVEPSRCVVFEDARAGVEAALRAGMMVIGVGKVEDLREACEVVGGLYELNVKKLCSILKENGNWVRDYK